MHLGQLEYFTNPESFSLVFGDDSLLLLAIPMSSNPQNHFWPRIALVVELLDAFAVAAAAMEVAAAATTTAAAALESVFVASRSTVPSISGLGGAMCVGQCGKPKNKATIWGWLRPRKL